MTKEFQVESWCPRGIGNDRVPHLVKGGESYLRPNISGFVNGLEAGKRVVTMFGGNARLDYREYEPDWVQVKVGVDKDEKEILERLMVACADGLLTHKRVAWAINPATNRDAEPQVIRAVRMKHTDSYLEVANRVQEIYDAKDEDWEEDRKAGRPYRA